MMVDTNGLSAWWLNEASRGVAFEKRRPWEFLRSFQSELKHGLRTEAEAFGKLLQNADRMMRAGSLRQVHAAVCHPVTMA